MNNTSQITPAALTLWSINFSVPEGNGSILILQTILTGTITHSSKLQIASCAFALGIPVRLELWDADQQEGSEERLCPPEEQPPDEVALPYQPTEKSTQNQK